MVQKTFFTQQLIAFSGKQSQIVFSVALTQHLTYGKSPKDQWHLKMFYKYFTDPDVP